MKKNIITLTIVSALFSQTASAETLEQAMSHTIQTNPKVLQALHQYKASAQQIAQEKADYLPSLDLHSSYRSDNTDDKDSKNLQSYSGDISLNLHQNIFNGLYTTHQVEKLNNQTLAKQWVMISMAEDTALQVAKAYMHYIEAEKMVTLANNNVEKHKNIYQRIKEKTESGLGSVADLSQIRGRLARARSNLIAAKNNLADARAEYIVVTNEQPTDLTVPSLNMSVMPKSLHNAIQVAEKNHPTIHAALSNINAIHADQNSVKSNYLPQFDLELGKDWSDKSYDRHHSFDNSKQQAYATIEMRYNLFKGGKDMAKERELAYRLSDSKDAEAYTYRQVVEGTTLAWNAYQYVYEQLDYIKQHINAAKDTQASYAQQFKLGQRSLVDLLDAENELFEARKDYLKSESDKTIAYYRILNATGQLLPANKIQVPDSWMNN
ncbi:MULTISPECIES: TolC family outer membrane protein [unclassified Photobacterium]|uniref:TolC family outer membrane protein n=1 Tax=unclassified Photobacterium TaxID=2628852 RepID=UPI001EDE40DA|nr:MULTISPECIES: TolC family outer membrane protein [unclassified Photobacterium]MCG3863136.1 TolC family outer membrane protein [Photobacterium sp. Ph6]MCG3874666.1 TolC family outer membrane protein [Photobacterium sp. Ph5]